MSPATSLIASDSQAAVAGCLRLKRANGINFERANHGRARGALPSAVDKSLLTRSLQKIIAQSFARRKTLGTGTPYIHK